MKELCELENLPATAGSYFETVIKPDFIFSSGAIDGPMSLTEDRPFK